MPPERVPHLSAFAEAPAFVIFFLPALLIAHPVGSSNSVTQATIIGRPFVSIANDTAGSRWSGNSSPG